MVIGCMGSHIELCFLLAKNVPSFVNVVMVSRYSSKCRYL